jgi:hypothetical protein
MAKDIGAESTEAFADIRMTSDNGFFLASCPTGISGYKTEASKGDRDYWIVKLNESGKFMGQTLGGDSLDQTQSIVQAKDGGYVTVGWSQSNMQEIKQKIKVEGKIWVVKLQLCSQNLSAASNSQFVMIPYNFLHQVELIIRGLDQLVLSPMNKTHLF